MAVAFVVVVGLVFVVAASDAAALKKALSDANEGGVVDLGVLAARGDRHGRVLRGWASALRGAAVGAGAAAGASAGAAAAAAAEAAALGLGRGRGGYGPGGYGGGGSGQLCQTARQMLGDPQEGPKGSQARALPSRKSFCGK